MAVTVWGSIPYSRSPRSASPESFSRTRWNDAGPPLEARSVVSSEPMLMRQRSLADERGGAWGTGRFPTFSRRRGQNQFSQAQSSLARTLGAEKQAETWLPPRTQADGARWSTCDRDSREA